jgi:hypothetical protein
MGEFVSTCLMIFGAAALLVVLAGVAAAIWMRRLMWRASAQLKDAATHILDVQRAVYGERHEYRTIDPGTDFPEADLAYYDAMREWFVARGFRHVGDIEDLPLSRALPSMRAFLRVMLSEDGTVQVAIFDVRPPDAGAERSYRSVNAEIELSNGVFVSVDNNAGADLSPGVPCIVRVMLPRETPPEEILRATHETAAKLCADEPGVRPVVLGGLEDVIASQRRSHEAKQAHYAQIGLMDGETLMGYATDERSREAAALLAPEIDRLKQADVRGDESAR